MNIKILYDNYSYSDEYLSGWGFSCLIDNSILFDVGEDFVKLDYNMKKMNVSEIELYLNVGRSSPETLEEGRDLQDKLFDKYDKYEEIFDKKYNILKDEFEKTNDEEEKKKINDQANKLIYDDKKTKKKLLGDMVRNK